MKRIAVVALVILIISASLSIGCKVDTETASVAELGKASIFCYALQHSPYNPDAYSKYSVEDIQVISKTTSVLAGSKITVWSIKATLYDANGQYVEDLEQNLIKTDFGEWVCQ